MWASSSPRFIAAAWALALALFCTLALFACAVLAPASDLVFWLAVAVGLPLLSTPTLTFGFLAAFPFASWYALATLNSSLIEGFGLPVFDASCLGLRSYVSDCLSHHEIYNLYDFSDFIVINKTYNIKIFF